MATEEEQLTQFQVIQFGSGAERIFVLDSTGKLWHATMATPTEEPKWFAVKGPPKAR